MELHDLGCCSAQGLVFPRLQAGKLVKWFEAERHTGSIDSLIDEYASIEENKEIEKWTVVPSVLQHMGHEPLKEDENAEDEQNEDEEMDAVSGDKIWNIGFERFDTATLKEEHRVLSEEGSEAGKMRVRSRLKK